MLYRHPLLDQKSQSDQVRRSFRSEIEQIVESFIRAAVRAQKAGFTFVHVKHCHGYLGHEFLSAAHQARQAMAAVSKTVHGSCARSRSDGVRRDAPVC